MPSSEITIRDVSAGDLEREMQAFARLLHACVQAGASINFVMPFAPADAEVFWRARVLPGLAGGGLVMLAASLDGRIVGTVQLDCDTPPNQPHRAEVRKLMVHPDCRRLGIARALMAAIEDIAMSRRRSLITLDTRTGDHAEPLYASLGYTTVGVVPGYCRDTFDPARLDSATIMYKALQDPA